MSKSNAATKKKISELAGRLNLVECRLLGIAPILRLVADSFSGEGEAGDSLEAIGGLSDYLSNEVGEIAQLMNEVTA